MKYVKKTIATGLALAGLCICNAANAGIPVIDGAHISTSIMNQVETIAKWVQQYMQMKQQYDQMVQQYNSLNGSRGMEALVNDPASRKYLPANYSQILNSGYGNWEQIQNDARIIPLSSTKVNSGTDSEKMFNAAAKQAAINRSTYEDGYKKADDRFAKIQVLLDKVGNAPDAKDIADLQARIQSEQAMLQNETIKLNMLTQLASAQKDIASQRATEIGMKSSAAGTPPRIPK